MYLGIEIGGTKLQVGLGSGAGALLGLWRGTVHAQAGAAGIRQQLSIAIPELLAQAGCSRTDLRAVGVGFGGPICDEPPLVLKSHHIAGWDRFPLANWVQDLLGLPTFLGNDADVAGLAEALHGAGRGYAPIFYITVGSGIGGGFVHEGRIYRGSGLGAAELGHLRIHPEDPLQPGRFLPAVTLEALASGWGIQAQARRWAELDPQGFAPILVHCQNDPGQLTVQQLARAAQAGVPTARQLLTRATSALAQGICHMVTLLCPRRIVIGGGVSLLGEELFFAPLRAELAKIAFAPFAGTYEIVPAELGETVVVHGAIALAKQKLNGG